MWRTRANAALLRTARSCYGPVHDKVVSIPKTLAQTLAQTPPPHPSTRRSFPYTHTSTFTRFFSDSTPDGIRPDRAGAEESESDSDSSFPEAVAASEEGEGLGEVDDEKLGEVLEVLRSSETGRLGESLDEVDLDFELSDEFVVGVLQNPEVCGEKLVGFVKWAVGKSDRVKNSGVIDLLVQEVCRRKYGPDEASALWEFVKEIGEVVDKDKKLLGTETVNQLIAGTAKLGRRQAVVVEMFDRFEDLGCVRDGDTYYWTILALEKRAWNVAAWRVCQKMLGSRCFPDGEKVGKIIRFFCNAGMADKAHKVYLMAKETQKCPPTPFLGCLAYHLAYKNRTVIKALELVEEYFDDPQTHPSWPFGSVVHGLCRKNDTERALKLLNRMLGASISPSKAVFNFVVTALCKAGKVDDAVAQLEVMKGIGLRPDIRAFNVIMSGFARDGRMVDARNIFVDAKKAHSKLGRTSYHILTQGYNRVEDFDKALDCMNEMKEEGIQPNVDEYRKMIQSLCLKALDWRAAEKLVEEMRECGLQLDGHTSGLIASVKDLEQEEMRSTVTLP